MGVTRQQMESRAFVGIGGNLGDRLATLRSATRSLAEGEVGETRVIAASPVYETRPLGPSTGAFLNAVIELRTRLLPRELLDELLGIETRHGRQRGQRWGARQRRGVDGWEAVEVEGEGLRVPHPEMLGRDFVLVPLGDLVGGEGLVRGRGPGEWVREIAEGERTILRQVAVEGELLEGG